MKNLVINEFTERIKSIHDERKILDSKTLSPRQMKRKHSEILYGKHMNSEIQPIKRSGQKRCGFCGSYLQPGDYYRLVYINGLEMTRGNPFACRECDIKDDAAMIEKWQQLLKEFLEISKKFWWFLEYNK